MKTERHEYPFMYGELTYSALKLANLIMLEANSRSESSNLQTTILDQAREVQKLLDDHTVRLEERAEYAAASRL